MADHEVTLDFVQGLAEAVGPLILEGFGCGSRSTEGAPGTKASAADLVTEFDTKVEETLKSQIRDKYPQHAFLCEGKAAPAAAASAAIAAAAERERDREGDSPSLRL